MGRKNHRVDYAAVDDVEPPSLSFPDPVPAPTRRRWETDEERRKRLNEEFGRKRHRNEQRVDRRVLEALVDWDHCCIPGCDMETTWPARPQSYETPSPARKLPICMYHAGVISLMLKPAETRAQMSAVEKRLVRRYSEVETEREKRDDIEYENGGAAQGQIYVIRQGGLIKVGWSSKLRSRLKHYGAGVEILAHYPATRTQETELHRSLRPYLAVGREWYQDCPLLADVVKGIHKRHGGPTIFPDWTVPKKDQAARPKGFPAA